MIFKKKYFITIETKLFNDLEQTVTKHNLHYSKDDNNIIKMDKAVFLLDYINFQKSYRKDDITENDYIRIPSKFLNIYLQKELKKYKDFLVAHKYIKISPYDDKLSQSYGYKICFNYNSDELDKVKREYIVYDFLSETYEKALLKYFEKNAKIEQKKKSADRNTRHLTKWINEENIKIDWQAAFNFIDNNKSLSIDCDTLIKLMYWLIDNIFVTFGDVCFQQVIGIPMGTDCAPFLANLFCYSYEFEWVDKRIKLKKNY